jgi:hypothetical protein
MKALDQFLHSTSRGSAGLDDLITEITVEVCDLPALVVFVQIDLVDTYHDTFDAAACCHHQSTINKAGAKCRLAGRHDNEEAIEVGNHHLL